MSEGQADPRRRQQGGEERPRGRGRAPRVQEDASNVTVIPTDVFVKRLPSDATEDNLRAAFGVFGAIASIRLTRRQTRLFASISFENADGARKALAAAADVKVLDQNVEVEQRRTVTRPAKPESTEEERAPRQRKPRQPKPAQQQQAPAAQQPPAEADPNSVWIGGIERTVTADDVTAFANKYGKVAKLTIRSRFAIVAFETTKAAQDAVANGNGQKIGDFAVTVAQARPQQPRAARQPRAEGGAAAAPADGDAPRRRQRTRQPNPSQVFVGGVTEESEEDIKKIFPAAVKIDRRRGFARLTFETAEAAQKALVKNNTELFAGKGPSRVELSR